jgi:hypothetical protein
MVSARPISDDFPTLMSLMAGSVYSIHLPRTEETDKAVARFDDLMALKEYVAVRRTKSGENPCDIRPFVKEGSISQTDTGYEIRLETITLQSGALKPSLWLESLCAFAECEKPQHIIYRDAILAQPKDSPLIPMEEYPHA